MKSILDKITHLLSIFYFFRFKGEAAEIQGFLEGELKKRNEKIDEMENELKNLTIISDSSKSQNKTLLNEIDNNKVFFKKYYFHIFSNFI